MESTPRPRPFAGLVEAATARGISRTVAYALVARGLLDVFSIGRRRYVYIDSLDTLGERLSEGDHKGVRPPERLAAGHR
jgi:hypothetical protein